MVERARDWADRAWHAVICLLFPPRGRHSRTRRTWGQRPIQAVVALLVLAGGLTTAFVSGSNADNTCQTGYGYGYSSDGSFGYGYGQCQAGAPPAFVIGDVSAGSGSGYGYGFGIAVNFWGAQWAKNNALSGGSAPSAMKGFVSNPPAVITCGTTWTTRTGNSSGPPATLPSTIDVIVSSHVTQSGSVISGNVLHIVMVHVNPGYGPDPGHQGFGTIIGTIC